MTHPLWLPHEDDALRGQIISTFDSGDKHVIISKWKSELVLPPKTTKKMSAILLSSILFCSCY